MPPLNQWRVFADRRLDRPGHVLELLARIAPALPPSRVTIVAELFAGSLARWVTRPGDVRRIAAVLQRLPLRPGARDDLLRRAQAINPRFGPYLTRRAILLSEARPGDEPTLGEEAVAEWNDLPPRTRTRALDELLTTLERWTGGPAAPRRRGGAPARVSRSALIADVAETAGISRASAARAFDALFDTKEGIILRAVREEGSLNLPGFGKFILKERTARKGRNPRTGTMIDVPGRSAIRFTPAKGFIEKTGRAPRKTSPRQEKSTPADGQESSGATHGSGGGFGTAIHLSWDGSPGVWRHLSGLRYGRTSGRSFKRRAGVLSGAGMGRGFELRRRRSGRARLVGSEGTQPDRRPRAPARGGARPERTVSNGFAAGPGRRPLPPENTLQAGAEYAFWLQVGRRVKGSIATGDTELDTGALQTGALIDVVLFPVGSAFQVRADLGQLRLEADGTVAVARQPGVPDELPARGLRARRLFFPVRAPETAGEHRLRCNLYHGQTLLQSWLVRARVTAQPLTYRRNALRSAPDYVLSHTLDPARLQALSPHRLSVLMNGNGDGTHSFFFKGAEDYRRPATLDAHALQDLIETGRGALRKAAWADDQPWTSGKAYVYGDGKRDLERLRADLERLARRGCDFYDALIGGFANGYDEENRLQQLMRRPGMVQIASRESATHVVPAALFYDRTALDRGSPAEFTLCPAFLQGLDDPRPLEEHPCFQGDCVSFGEPEVVCPSGFWGFRHALGMPLSVGKTAPDVDEALAYADAPGMAVAVWRDFTRRAQHEAVLRTLRPDLVWQYADTRKAALSLLASTRSPVVYFYCHGGMEKNVPYLLVGGKNEGFIAPSSFRGRIRWNQPRPLVFINGCETGALEPETALSLVSALVERANASGVIGAEITIFEPLACEFAEEFLRRFVVQGQRLGEAVRGARLALLKRGNPLGLVYIPFAIAGLHLVQQA